MKTSQKTAKNTNLKELKNNFEALRSDFPAENNFNPNTEFNLERFTNFSKKQEKKEPKRIRKTEMVFNLTDRRERIRITNEIKELIKTVKEEVKLLKSEDQSLINDISKLSLNEIGERPGIYHLRFLEFIIMILRSIRKKISEGRLWLETTFQKKRAKKFRGLAKSKGTKFSMSKELSQANSPG